MAYTKINNVLSTAMSKVNNVAVGDIAKVDNVVVPVSDFVWSSGGAMYSARQGGGAAGTQLAALYGSGYGGSPAAYQADCGEYNGTVWTQVSVGSFAAAKTQHAMGGTQGSALEAGGQTSSAATDTVESYNGSSWSSEATINAAASAIRGTGASSSSFTLSGGDPAAGTTDKCEQFNGSSWSNIADLNDVTKYHETWGTADDCMVASSVGYPGAMNKVEQYNGTSWSNTAVRVAYQRQQGGSFGTTSSAVIFCGSGAVSSGDSYVGQLDNCEQWNGTAWSAEDNYTAALNEIYGCGARASGTGGGLGIGGWTGSASVDTTQEYG